MKVRENPYVTQLAIARPNPYQPISSPNSKEGRDMLNRRNPTVSSNANRGNKSSSSISSAEAMQKRRNLQAAIAAIEANSTQNPAKSYSNMSRGYALEEDVELFDNPRHGKAKRKTAVKSTAKKKTASAKKTRSNPVTGLRTNAKRRKKPGGTFVTTTRGMTGPRLGKTLIGEKKAALPTVTGDVSKLDISKITDIAKQVRLLKREYAVSQSPATKKRLERAVRTLDQMSALIDKDLSRLQKASEILNENPKKGATMAKKTRRKSAARRKTSSSIFSKLMTKVQAKKKAGSTKRKARKNPGITALGAATVGIENPRKRRKSSSKMSRAVMSALTDFSPTHLVITRNGKTHKLKAQKTSAEFKAAKSKGLSGRFASLKGKKNAHNCLSVRSVKSLSGSTASLSEIQKALNAWAGAYEGGKLSARHNPRKKATVKRSTAAKRKTGMKVVRRRKARKNPVGITALGAATVGIENPRKRRSSSKKRKTAANTYTTKRSRKTSVRKRRVSRKATAVASQVKRRKSRAKAAVHHNPRKRRSSTKRKTSAKKRRKSHGVRKSSRRARRNPVDSLVPMGYALMHNNPMHGMHGMRGLMRHNGAEISTGAKVGYGVLGASLFLTGSNIIGGLVQDHIVSKEAKADKASNTPMIAEVATHLAVGGLAYGVYRSAPQDESIKSFAIGSAIGVVGSLISRTVAKDMIANSFLGGFFRATGGQGEFAKTVKEEKKDEAKKDEAKSGYGRYVETRKKAKSGYGEYVPEHTTVGEYVPEHTTVGKFLSESPLETLSGMGRYVEVPVSQSSPVPADQSQGYSVATSGLSSYFPTPSQPTSLEGTNMRHLHGLTLRNTEDMGTQVLSAQNAPQDMSRIGGHGFDLSQLSQELRDVDSLSFEELRAEGIPEVNVGTVAVIRATPYYARQIVESNLGYMMTDSKIVPGSYLVGLFIGPDSMLYNTGIGARDLSIPHGVRNSRPAGIFTHTVFSSVLPTADGEPIWAGGDDGDL